MAKQNPYVKDMDGIFGRKVVDDNAFTVREVAERSGNSTSHTTQLVRRKMLAGEIEQVWKRVGVRLVAAYRPKRG